MGPFHLGRLKRERKGIKMINFDSINLNKWEPEQKQGDTIKYILENAGMKDVPEIASLEKKFKKAIENGICYMLSMEWLHLIVTGKPEWATTYGTMDDVQRNTAYYKQIATNFFALADKSLGVKNQVIGGLSYSSIQADSEFVALSMRGAAKVVGEQVANSADELAGAMVNGKQLMFIRLGLNGGAHQVAAYRESDTCLYFFDPNYGTIKVSAANAAELLTKLKQLADYFYTKVYKVQQAVVRYLE